MLIEKKVMLMLTMVTTRAEAMAAEQEQYAKLNAVCLLTYGNQSTVLRDTAQVRVS